MMSFHRLLLILISSFSVSAPAQNSPTEVATQTLIFLGTMTWGAHQGMEGMKTLELKDWQSDQTGVTAQIGNQCEILYEARLIGNNRYNLIALFLKNSKEKNQNLKVEDIVFKFSGGRERRPLVDSYSDLELKPKQQYVVFLAFPSKTDFKDQTSITLHLPFTQDNQTCSSQVVMSRNLQRPVAIRSVTRATVFDVHMYLGTSQAQGDYKKILNRSSSESFGIDLDLTGVNWGSFLRYKFNSPAGIKESVKTTEAFPLDHKVQYNMVGLGVLYRKALSADDFLIYRLGYLIGSYRFFKPGKMNDSIDEDLNGWTLGLGWKRYFARVDTGIWQGDYSWGIEMSHDLIDPLRLPAGTPVGGSMTSLQLSIGVGY